jgi:hypothetical protein
MVLYFDNCDVAINRSGIMATSVSISSSSNLFPAYSIGKLGANQFPSAAQKYSCQINYIPEINNEPNFATVNEIKSLLEETQYTGNKIEVAGISQNYWFLTQYSLKIQPNSIPDTSASYETYWPMCATDITPKNNYYNYDRDGSIPHGWASLVNIANSGYELYDFTYDFKANWTPIYTIGNKYPNQVKLMGGEESISFSTNLFVQPGFSGMNLLGSIISGDSDIVIQDLSMYCSTGYAGYVGMTFATSGMVINASEMGLAVGDIIRVNVLAKRYF